MGARGIVVLKFSEGYCADLAVYSHWTGPSLLEQVRDIAASENFTARLGMGDESYCARIMIDQITTLARDEQSGFGVFPLARGQDATRLSDGEVEAEVDLATGVIWSFRTAPSRRRKEERA